MGVIRKELLASPPAFSFADVEQQAHDILARAQAKAKEIIADSESRIRAATEEQKREGYREGIAEGREAGIQQAVSEAREYARRNAEAELRQLAAAMNAVVQNFESGKHTLIAQAESGLLELALAIAGRVCKIQAAGSEAVARENVRALLELVKHRDDVAVHVHPSDHELLAVHMPEVVQSINGIEHVTLVPDETIERGGCVLRTRDGSIDATIGTQLERVARALAIDDSAAPSEEEPSP